MNITLPNGKLIKFAGLETWDAGSSQWMDESGNPVKGPYGHPYAPNLVTGLGDSAEKPKLKTYRRTGSYNTPRPIGLKGFGEIAKIKAPKQPLLAQAKPVKE